MEITLHLGAHRCASTSFQWYMRKNAVRLAASGIGFWGPQQTRMGLLEGVFPSPGPLSAAKQATRAKGRLALALAKVEDTGIQHLIISDENLIGAPRRNLRDMRLYPGIGERIARYCDALDGQTVRAAISVRAQDAWWASNIAFAVARGAQLPSRMQLAHIAASPRNWRDAITDLACALPEAQLIVMPHEIFASVPERRLAMMLNRADMPRAHAREWLNRSPDLPALRAALAERGSNSELLPQGEGPWQPFGREECAALREAYADDLYWLRAGADGLATLIEEHGQDQAGQTPPVIVQTRGQEYDQEGARGLAQAGRGGT